MSSVREVNPENHWEALHSCHKNKWTVAIKEDFESLKSNRVWIVVVPSKYSPILHTKWVIKTKANADGAIERLKPG